MPVWHEATRAAREQGELAVVGIVQEQHRERTRLYAQWKAYDWPIMWDPFNTTESKVVPRVFAIDEYGVIRSTNLRPKRLVEDFLGVEFPTPAHEGPKLPALKRPTDAAARITSPAEAMALAIWEGESVLDRSLRVLERQANREGAQARDHFRLGVVHRLRVDSSGAQADDFQASIDRWSLALSMDPNQYIWRRRLQQYGPRLDKPYPFYDWIEDARRDIRARGEEPLILRAHLTESELAQPAKVVDASTTQEEPPDPNARIHRDKGQLIRLETAVAPHTGEGKGADVMRIHLTLRPDAEREVHWGNEAGGVVLWLDVPEGWELERQRHELPPGVGAQSSELRSFDFEIQAGLSDKRATSLTGYLLYYVCEGEGATCLYLRRDLTLSFAP